MVGLRGAVCDPVAALKLRTAAVPWWTDEQQAGGLPTADQPPRPNASSCAPVAGLSLPIF